jgi:hypothetical protein
MFHRVGYGLTTAFTMDDVITMLQVRRHCATSFRRPADDVVDKALNYVFSKDPKFQKYLKPVQSCDVYLLCGPAEVGMGKHLSLPRQEAYRRGGA